MARSKCSAEGPRGYYEPSARNDALRKTSGEETAMSEDRTVDERAEALIDVAHPDLRDGLREAWAKQTSQEKDQ
jgi:hypothetical protein